MICTTCQCVRLAVTLKDGICEGCRRTGPQLHEAGHKASLAPFEPGQRVRVVKGHEHAGLGGEVVRVGQMGSAVHVVVKDDAGDTSPWLSTSLEHEPMDQRRPYPTAEERTNEAVLLRTFVLMGGHTEECLRTAAVTRRAFCIAQCADARRAILAGSPVDVENLEASPEEAGQMPSAAVAFRNRHLMCSQAPLAVTEGTKWRIYKHDSACAHPEENEITVEAAPSSGAMLDLFARILAETDPRELGRHIARLDHLAHERCLALRFAAARAMTLPEAMRFVLGGDGALQAPRPERDR